MRRDTDVCAVEEFVTALYTFCGIYNVHCLVQCAWIAVRRHDVATVIIANVYWCDSSSTLICAIFAGAVAIAYIHHL